jgi:hypothetical protein
MAVSEARLPDPPWASLGDAELLSVRICDLGVRLEGSELEPRVRQLQEELKARGLTFEPDCYLGDEWFSPENEPAIAIPFYLAHPRLKALERKMMMEVEGGEPGWCMRLLRHECGHALEHAFRLHNRSRRKELFGPRSADYDPDNYKPQPYSRSFVRNLPNWYAQAHPDEDFAETFAVWLDPEHDWRTQYRGWKALAKLEYVDALMRELAGRPPKVARAQRAYPASRLRATLETYYRKRKKLYAEDAPDFYDRDLQKLFAPAGTEGASRTSAANYLRSHRKHIIDSVARWAGERKVTIEHLVKKLAARAQQLGLPLGRDEAQASIEVTAFLTTLVTNYRFTGKFKRSV